MTLRLPGVEERQPYPGLAAFTEQDAEYFFGREVEVEAVWKKLKRPRLLGVIGPSGAGKSSFLRAGLLPTLPPSWKRGARDARHPAVPGAGTGARASVRRRHRGAPGARPIRRRRRDRGGRHPMARPATSTRSSSSISSRSCSRRIRRRSRGRSRSSSRASCSRPIPT